MGETVPELTLHIRPSRYGYDILLSGAPEEFRATRVYSFWRDPKEIMICREEHLEYALGFCNLFKATCRFPVNIEQECEEMAGPASPAVALAREINELLMQPA